MAGKLQDRIALITGASRGIGYAVARGFAAEGAHVIALARTSGALEELDDEIKQAGGGGATLVPLDIRDGEGIDRLGASIFERWGRLDVFIGNAGILGPLSPLHHISPKDWEELVAVNLTANWRLIRSLDPLLRASPAGRAVFVSSGAASINTPFWGGYGTTKAALEYLAKTYAAEVAETSNIRVNIVNPGATRTAMRAKAMPGEDSDILPQPSELVPLFLELASGGCLDNGRVFDFRTWKQIH